MLFDPIQGRISLVENWFSIDMLSRRDKAFSFLATLEMTGTLRENISRRQFFLLSCN